MYKRVLGLIISLMIVFSAIPAVNAINQDDPWSIHGFDYYGRNLLEEMPNARALLYAYDSLAVGVENCSQSISLYNGDDPLSSTELNLVLDLYKRDYAQHFWVDHFENVKINSSTILSVDPVYSISGNKLTQAREWFDLTVNEILAGITEDMSEYQKELYFHDILADRVTYYTGTANCHNAYGALVEGYAACDGYSFALQYLLHREGIQSFIAIGYAYNFKAQQTEAHSWNYVRIDGKYYQTDLTWDDQDDTVICHEFFNVSDSEMAEYHYVSSVDYSLPVCDSLDANYHLVNGTRLDTYTAKQIGELLKANGNTVSIYIPGDVSAFMSFFTNNVRNIASAAGLKSYTVQYGRLNREFILVFGSSSTAKNVASVEYQDKCTFYTSVASAIANAETGYVKLLTDCSENLNITKDVYIDLNGYNMTGKISVLSGATLFGMDSSTDDYNCADGYGKITNISGNVSVHHKSNVTGMVKRYLTIREENAVSFHRIFLGVVYMSLQPSSDGMGYKAIYAGDQMVVAQLDEEKAYGFKLCLEGGEPISVFNNKEHFVSGRKVNMIISNYNIEKYGLTNLSAQVILHFKDGTLIESTQVSTSMRSLLENLNTNTSSLSQKQFAALLEMLLRHPIIKAWKTEMLYNKEFSN